KSRRTASTSRVLVLDVDVVAINLHLVGLRRNHRRKAGHRAVEQAEARTVRRALDVQAPELAVAQRVLLMRADVADRVILAVLGVRQADLLAVDDHLLHGVDLEVLDLGDQVPGHRGVSQSATPVPTRPALGPEPPGCGPAPPRRIRARSSARRW